MSNCNCEPKRTKKRGSCGRKSVKIDAKLTEYEGTKKVGERKKTIRIYADGSARVTKDTTKGRISYKGGLPQICN